jgi:hypothetical protein
MRIRFKVWALGTILPPRTGLNDTARALTQLWKYINASRDCGCGIPTFYLNLVIRHRVVSGSCWHVRSLSKRTSINILTYIWCVLRSSVDFPINQSQYSRPINTFKMYLSFTQITMAGSLPVKQSQLWCTGSL